jgi:glycosyltransferase involved in cell wall biosynthesis
VSNTRVWLLSHNFRPIWAGPAERFSRYAPLLEKNGVEFTIMTAMRAHQPAQEFIPGAQVRRLGPDCDIPESSKEFMIRALTLARTERPKTILMLAAEVSHIPYILVLRALGIKVIYVSTMALEFGKDSDSKLLLFLKSKALFGLYSSFDSVVCSTQKLSQGYQDIGVSAKKLKIIPNGVDVEKYKPVQDLQEKQAIRDELGLPQDTCIAMFMGLMVQRKGVIPLVQAWKLHKTNNGDDHLLLVGGERRDEAGSEAFYSEWDSLKETITDSDNIIFHSTTNNPALYFKAADLFVFCSYIEGLPNVLLEAMSTGLPLLTTRFKGFSDDYGTEAVHYLSTSHQPDDIRKKLNMLIEKDDLRAELKSKSRPWIIDHHKVADSITKYFHLINGDH